jgi:hypothetical protein
MDVIFHSQNPLKYLSKIFEDLWCLDKDKTSNRCRTEGETHPFQSGSGLVVASHAQELKKNLTKKKKNKKKKKKKKTKKKKKKQNKHQKAKKKKKKKKKK